MNDVIGAIGAERQDQSAILRDLDALLVIEVLKEFDRGSLAINKAARARHIEHRPDRLTTVGSVAARCQQ